MKTIQIKNINGQVIYEHTQEGNSVRVTVEKAVRDGVALRYADLRGAFLEGADLRGVDLRGVDLQGVDLRGVDLRGVDLRGVDLQGADLRGADLRGSDLQRTFLQGANLQGANLYGEILTKTPVFLEYEYLITITEGYLRIGCQRHTHEEWKAFTDDEIHKMDGEKASTFWSARKDELLKLCKGHAVS